jgi:hypothetical protein
VPIGLNLAFDDSRIEPANIEGDVIGTHTKLPTVLAGQSSRRPERRPALARGRRLVVVDIENIVCGACLTAAPVRWAKRVLTDMLHLRETDHVVVGTSHIGLLQVGCNWPHIRLEVRSGRDGADLALLEVLDENVPARFERIALASGDGIFSAKISELAAQGVPTTVVGDRRSIARSLRMAASQVLYLPGPRPAAGPVEAA